MLHCKHGSSIRPGGAPSGSASETPLLRAYDTIMSIATIVVNGFQGIILRTTICISYLHKQSMYTVVY